MILRTGYIAIDKITDIIIIIIITRPKPKAQQAFRFAPPALSSEGESDHFS